MKAVTSHKYTKVRFVHNLTPSDTLDEERSILNNVLSKKLLYNKIVLEFLPNAPHRESLCSFYSLVPTNIGMV